MEELEVGNEVEVGSSVEVLEELKSEDISKDDSKEEELSDKSEFESSDQTSEESNTQNKTEDNKELSDNFTIEYIEKEIIYDFESEELLEYMEVMTQMQYNAYQTMIHIGIIGLVGMGMIVGIMLFRIFEKRLLGSD